MTENLSSSTYSDYLSDYNIDNSIDITLNDKLVNIDNDEIFMLKHDFFSNYGADKYAVALEEYNNEIKKIDFNTFNVNIWNKCFELYEKEKSIDADFSQTHCFSCILKPRKTHIDTKHLNQMFVLFNHIHKHDVKTKTWLSIVERVKKY